MYACRMYHRWTSTYRFKWTPILTYTRRHLGLLDWFEANLEPVAFVENPGYIGVALVTDDLRVTVRRDRMVLESGLSGASITHLARAVEGIFEVFEPSDVVLTGARSTSTVEIPGGDYHELCAAFGRKMGSETAVVGGFRAVDGSALVDLRSDRAHVQAEWGIVEASELLFRMTNPDVGRLTASGSASAESRKRAGRLIADDLPPVSTLVDISSTWVQGGEVSDSSSVESAIAIADTDAQDVSESLVRDFLEKVRKPE